MPTAEHLSTVAQDVERAGLLSAFDDRLVISTRVSPPPSHRACSCRMDRFASRSEGSGSATVLPAFEDVAKDHAAVDSWADPVSIVPLEHPEVFVAKLIGNLLDWHAGVGHERRG